MSLMPLFNGRKNHARRVQNPSPAATITHQSQTNQDPPPTKNITHKSQTSRGLQDPYNPSHEFYLETRRSLIAPALSFPHEPPSLAQVEFETTPEAHVFRANLHGYKKEEVKVQVEDDRVLKITGEKKIVQKGYDNWHHFHRRIGKFSTAFNLPDDARVDKVKSSMENGVLIVTVPKKGANKSNNKTAKMSLMPLFNGRKNHARRVQNPSPAATITHQSQTNQDPPPTKNITHKSQTSRGLQDPYNPSHEFYLETRRSLIAPALSFPHEPPSLAQVEFETTPEAHVFRANLHGYKKEEVKVQVEDDRVLKITGEKKIVQKGYDNWHHFHRRIGKFSTAFNLPDDARVDKVKSSMENGVLIVTVPKKGANKSNVRTVRIF
ncbi:hypothetical protein K7X08_037842 [Anisodus acutangulus]|uniref:SHSP domain-containing protein n=1 Tax=Anisodus acutangulus TaxID=402998 RepID=A0A9Q1RTM7_9SOLA|nr:hypothetical protein K7X08_037842 [Anisodus acutangulus]